MFHVSYGLEGISCCICVVFVAVCGLTRGDASLSGHTEICVTPVPAFPQGCNANTTCNYNTIYHFVSLKAERTFVHFKISVSISFEGLFPYLYGALSSCSDVTEMSVLITFFYYDLIWIDVNGMNIYVSIPVLFPALKASTDPLTHAFFLYSQRPVPERCAPTPS